LRACITWPPGRRDEDVVHVADLLPVFLAQPHDDRVLEPALAEERGLGAGDVGANRRGDLRDAEAEQGRLLRVDAHGQLGPAFFAPDLHVGHARRVLHHLARVERHASRVGQIEAADLQGQAAVAAAAEHAVDDEVAARRPCAHDHARQPRELPASACAISSLLRVRVRAAR
jgi:hypothetical protein